MDSLPARPEPSRPFSEVAHAWLQWFGVARLVVSAFAILAVGAGGYWLLRAPAAPVENSLPHVKASNMPGSVSAVPAGTGTTALAATTSSPPAATVMVYVAGAVVSPGVYRLSTDARVQQAVGAAGGVTADADIEALNLAAFVRDGDRIYVPHIGIPVPAVVGSTSASAGRPSSTGGAAVPIDLNRASVEEFDALPGIGPATAAAIVTHREQSGPYSSVDDLLKVPGLGPAKVDAIRSRVHA